MGVLCVVRKRRELFGWENVRIHLDQVEGLGNFIEFEGVVSPVADERLSRERVDHLVNEFAISDADQIGVSYSDLILAKKE
jgi:predicted adenylyl cyclase CyaB